MSRQTKRAYLILAGLTVPLIVGLLFTYQIIKIPVPTNMAENPTTGYQEGHRGLPPAGAVPIEGQAIVFGTLPDNPVNADAHSLQRGEILYSIHCALCHGEDGTGGGTIAAYYEDAEADPPPDITGSNIARQEDGKIFRIITQGQKGMPALYENLTVRERWDVVNHLRTLTMEN